MIKRLFYLMQHLRIIVVLISASALSTNFADDATPGNDIVVADFESESYGSWKRTGEAFGSGPARGTLPGQMHVDGYQGQRLVNTFFQGDGTTGTLTSPEFTIERRYIRFLIGGGHDPEKLVLRLRVGEKVVRSATGPNDRPGGSETLSAEAWDVAPWLGKNGVIEIVDQATGGWGHLNVDDIIQSDRRPPGLIVDARREIVASTRYLHLPIKNGAPKRVLSLYADGMLVVKNDVELAPADPDWWAPMDITAWKGKRLTLQVDRLPEDSQGLAAIEASDQLRDARELYDEPLRGQFHFSPRRGWNNDPNGMVYYNQEYHLFFQHNPYGWGWGNMHWGHAVSPDMVHWQELRDELLPDPMGPMFSGSAVVDWKNTSGFGKDGQPPMVLFYTAAGNPTVQCLAYSTDGRTFTKYAGNPVVKQVTTGNRDPKVIWHEPTKKWVMVLYVTMQEGKHSVHFFTSPNLRDWTLASITEGIPGTNFLFECPDFFELPIDDDATRKKWILLGANSEYDLGTFDGVRFTPEQRKLPGHRGRGFYAPQTFSDVPDGRRIQMGWFQTETKGMPFNQSMTIPLELKLTGTPDGPRLSFHPVPELTSLRGRSHSVDAATIRNGGPNPLEDFEAELVELRAELEPSTSKEVLFTVRGARIAYDFEREQLTVQDHRVPAPARHGKQTLTIFCDRQGLEVFACDGLVYVPMPFLPKPNDRALRVEVRGEGQAFSRLEAYELRSAWK